MNKATIRWIACAVVLTCGVTLIARSGAPALAASPSNLTSLASTDPDRPLHLPSEFHLEGSNGYSLDVVGLPARKGHASAVLILVNGKHAGVSYAAPATVTETSIEADLGELGEISVAFHPSGLPRTARSKCGGKSISFDSGYFEGRVDFHGEESYTEVEAAAAQGSIDFLLNVICASGGPQGPSRTGAELSVRNPGLGAELSVVKNRSGGPARFEIGVSEYHGGISIKRFAALRLPARTFRYDPRLETATVSPPAPFAGSAHFDRNKNASRRWGGDLTVDMPGRADVPLTGTALRATLVRALGFR